MMICFGRKNLFFNKIYLANLKAVYYSNYVREIMKIVMRTLGMAACILDVITLMVVEATAYVFAGLGILMLGSLIWEATLYGGIYAVVLFIVCSFAWYSYRIGRNKSGT